ncbi:MAG: PH domain-containing protein [Desulfarculus sp.]|nr:PH domain-containing protein [Desulfarculus sp.]
MSQQDLEYFSDFRPAWKAFAVYFFGMFVFLAGPLLNPEAMISPALGQLLASLFLAFILVRRLGCRYRVDAENVTAELTLPSRQVKTAPIASIRRIDLRRGASQRLLGVAHVHLYVEGSEPPAVKLFGVPRPEALRQLLLDLGAKDQRVFGAWRK